VVSDSELELADVLELAIEAAQPSGAAVAVVEACGERSAKLRGARVLVPAFEPCGQCDVCRRGGPAVCAHAKRHGGSIELRARVSSRWVVALGDGLDVPGPAAAAIAGDVATAYTMYARTNLGPREPAVITGATAVARFLVEILRAKSITPVVLADPDDAAWCEWIASRGAAVARSPADVGAQVAAQGLGTRPLRLLATDGADAAAALAGPRATLTVLASAAVRDVPAALLAAEVTIIGVAGPHPDLIVEAAALCARGEIDLAGGVTTDPADRTRALIAISARS
jgi:6-hydroxycyclohex-1-ene-1-carbonyl-CoA dehydrogenase